MASPCIAADAEGHCRVVGLVPPGLGRSSLPTPLSPAPAARFLYGQPQTMHIPHVKPRQAVNPDAHRADPHHRREAAHVAR